MTKQMLETNKKFILYGLSMSDAQQKYSWYTLAAHKELYGAKTKSPLTSKSAP